MRILISAPFGERHRKDFQEAAGAEELIYADPLKEKERYWRELNRVQVIIGNPSLKEVQSAPCLRFLQSTNAGIERYTKQPGFPAGVVLCNMTGAFGGIISEYVVGAILMMYRRFREYDRRQGQRLWRDAGSELMLKGKRALILGTGDIGVNTAKRLKAFDVHIMGIRRNIRCKPEFFDEIGGLQELDGFLPGADIIIGCVPETKETVHLLDGDRLREVKQGCLIVNVGRGSLIETQALVERLQSGHIFGAVLDVTEPEPLPPDHALWSLPNVLLTPHIAGVSFGHTPEVEDAIAQICCENIAAFLKGRELRNVVEWEGGC